MLGRRITDRVESRSPDPVAGLGLLDVEVRFAPEKTLRNVSGVDTATGTHTPVEGYEIHHGHVERSGEDPLLVLSGGPDEGGRRGHPIGPPGRPGTPSIAVSSPAWRAPPAPPGAGRPMPPPAGADAGPSSTGCPAPSRSFGSSTRS